LPGRQFRRGVYVNVAGRERLVGPTSVTASRARRLFLRGLGGFIFPSLILGSRVRYVLGFMPANREFGVRELSPAEPIAIPIRLGAARLMAAGLAGSGVWWDGSRIVSYGSLAVVWFGLFLLKLVVVFDLVTGVVYFFTCCTVRCLPGLHFLQVASGVPWQRLFLPAAIPASFGRATSTSCKLLTLFGTRHHITKLSNHLQMASA
jgi:hypothetical protein